MIGNDVGQAGLDESMNGAFLLMLIQKMLDWCADAVQFCVVLFSRHRHVCKLMPPLIFDPSWLAHIQIFNTRPDYLKCAGYH